INCVNFNHALTSFAAIGTCVHAQSAADGTWNTVIEMETTNSVIHRHRSNMLIWADCTGLDAVFASHFQLSKSLRRKANQYARDSAITYKQVRADTHNS